MSSEDTFNMLRRTDFETVRKEWKAWAAEQILLDPCTAIDILNRHGWNYIDFTNEVERRWNQTRLDRNKTNN